MPQISIGYGAANFKDCGASFGALRVKPPFARDSAAVTGKTIPGTGTYTAAGRLDAHKGFSMKTVEHPYETVLMFTGTRTRRGMRWADGAIFLRLREGAGVVHVYGKVPGAPENTCGDTIQLFAGNADVLTVEDCHLHGIFPPDRYVRDRMNADEMADCFDVRVLTKGTPKPTPQLVNTEDGLQYREIAAPRVRQLRIRRG